MDGLSIFFVRGNARGHGLWKDYEKIPEEQRYLWDVALVLVQMFDMDYARYKRTNLVRGLEYQTIYCDLMRRGPTRLMAPEHQALFDISTDMRRIFVHSDTLQYRLSQMSPTNVFIHVENLTLRRERAHACKSACLALMQCLSKIQKLPMWDLRVLVVRTAWSMRRDAAWDAAPSSSETGDSRPAKRQGK